MRELILASASPRRKELLAIAGFLFQVRVRPVEEVRRAGELPVDYVRRLARSKAEAVLQPGETVLGADTVVVVDDKVLEKPRDAADAFGMLEALSGREHQVITGICLLYDGGALVDHAVTSVVFST